MNEMICECNFRNKDRYFCKVCGKFLDRSYKESDTLPYQKKISRIVENLKIHPHRVVIFDEDLDEKAKKIEKLYSLSFIGKITETMKEKTGSAAKNFIEKARDASFQIALVGAVKAGKSTLVNSLIGRNYASMEVTPETAALTKFRYSNKDYINIKFYSKEDFCKIEENIKTLDPNDEFFKEYKKFGIEKIKNNYVGQPDKRMEIPNDRIEKELKLYSSSQYPEHLFVQEIEIGISTIPSYFPKEVVFVDTPGLMDPVKYRSELTSDYIRKASAVFVCIPQSSIRDEELRTLQNVFQTVPKTDENNSNKNNIYVVVTRYDEFNNPVDDFKKQKEHIAKLLEGECFYGSKDLALQNILPSSAYIFNVLRDMDSLKQSMYSPESFNLISFAGKSGLKPEMNIGEWSDEFVDSVREQTHISELMEIIKNKLISRYKTVISRELNDLYDVAIDEYRKVVIESKKDLEELIEISRQDESKIEKLLQEKTANFKSVSQACELLKEDLKKAEQRGRETVSKVVDLIKKSKKKV